MFAVALTALVIRLNGSGEDMAILARALVWLFTFSETFPSVGDINDFSWDL